MDRLRFRYARSPSLATVTDLTIRLCDGVVKRTGVVIESSGMTQTEAVARLGIAQSRVSDLVRDKWDKFSLEMLIILEARAGRRVRLELAA